MKRFLEELPRRLMYAFCVYGIGQFVGIPIVGSIVARLLDGVAVGASSTANYIRYQDAREANQIISAQLAQGATIDRLYNNQDGTVAVRYDISAYTGEKIEADTLEAIANWL